MNELITQVSDNLYVLLIILIIILLLVVVFLLFKNNRIISALFKMNEQLSGSNAELQKLLNELNTIRIKKKELLNENESYKHFLNIEFSENKRLKEQLRKANQRADEADLLKTNFLANMSHEVRTPMNGILGFAQLLRSEDMTPEKRDRYVDIIYHNGQMLVNLIDDIVDIAKIEAGQLTINKTSCNLSDLLFDIYVFFNEIKYKQEKEHLTLRYLNLNDDDNHIVNTDSLRLRQVLSNLLSNAVKFTEKGIIEFGYINQENEGNLIFYVKDTGIGIPEDKLDIIFHRFRQANEGSTRKYGGTGIGLYISKHIVSLLGGNIWVESIPDQGSTFYFTIPYQRVRQMDNNTLMFETYNKEYIWKDKVILIAEDVDANYTFLNTLLENTQAKVIWAKDGEEAVDICLNNDKINVVLMDIQMPKLNGYDATKIIKKNCPRLPIIAQTAYAMPNDNIKCLEAGCDDYISKPINQNLLLEKIEQYLKISV